MLLSFVIGRIILGSFILMSAFNHFAKLGEMAGYTASKGVPAPKLAVAGSGVVLLVAGASILTGWEPVVGVIAVVLFFLPVSLLMHAFWKERDQMARRNDQVNFMKNMALLGSALMLLAIPRPWPCSIGS